MDAMVIEQSQAADEKRLAQANSIKLIAKQKEIAERKIKVDSDLGEAEPALLAAQESVSGIQTKDLRELKSFQNPPAQVKIGLEPVVALLNQKNATPDWKEIKGKLGEADFINQIMNFDKDSIKPHVKEFLNKNYLKDAEKFNTDRIMKASKATGPLALWVSSIVKYSEIFHSITPLRNELKGLEEEETRMLGEK